MPTQKHQHIALLILIFVISGGALFYFLKIDKKDQERDHMNILVQASKKVFNRWQSGNDESRWVEGYLSCEDLLSKAKDTAREYLQCNPNFLTCWYRYRNEEVFLEGGSNASVKVTFPKGNELPWKRIGEGHNKKILIKLEYGDKSLLVGLSDTCHETWLPHRYYAYGTYNNKKEDWRWDNFNRHIFVDKQMVTKRDIWEWMHSSQYDEKYGLNYKIKVEEFPEAASGLTLNQMHHFCSWHGKQLMEAHVYDAMAFHPVDYENKTPLVNIRGHYPWSRSNQTFHRELLDNPEAGFQEEYCDKIFTSECKGLRKFENFSNMSLSWLGIRQLLGGIMEVQRNSIHPVKNLMSSSFYFNGKSPVHQLGVRSNWDGEGQDLKDFNFGRFPPDFEERGPYKVGFRCMREISGF